MPFNLRTKETSRSEISSQEPSPRRKKCHLGIIKKQRRADVEIVVGIKYAFNVKYFARFDSHSLPYKRKIFGPKPSC